MKKTIGENVENWYGNFIARSAGVLHIVSFLLVGSFGVSYISTAALEDYNLLKIKNKYGITGAASHCNKVLEDFSAKNEFVQLFSGKDNVAEDYLTRLKNK